MTKQRIALALLLLFFGLSLASAHDDSPTMDEQNHIARGLAYLRTGDARLSVEHPPLVNSLSALPLLLLDVKLPLDDWSWEAGEWYHFADLLLWQVNHDADRMVFLARLPIVLLGVLLGALIFRVVNSMYAALRGASSGILSPELLALGLYVLDPNILAHSHYSTTDFGATVFVFLAAFTLWRATRADFSAGRVLLAGLAYGLALSAKLSATVFGLIFALVAGWQLLVLWRQRRRFPLAETFRLGLLYPTAALLVVWAVFGFNVGPMPAGGRAVPMPVFWQGVGTILDFSAGGRPAFLLGHFSTEGFWYYFPVSFGLKTPLATLLLLAWSLVVFVVGRRWRGAATGRSAALFLLAPAVLYFAISTRSALNLGYRHLLPILPFLFAFIGLQLGQVTTQGARVALAAAGVWLLLANGFIFPHYLSYFNEIIGPKNGYQALVDSNIDWGQDLKRLGRWMDENNVEQVKLAWFGSAPPEYYGIHYDPLPGLPHHFDLWEQLPFDPQDPEPGVYAISVSVLEELFRRDEDKTVFAWFRAREPDDQVGYSILIYEVVLE